MIHRLEHVKSVLEWPNGRSNESRSSPGLMHTALWQRLSCKMLHLRDPSPTCEMDKIGAQIGYPFDTPTLEMDYLEARGCW